MHSRFWPLAWRTAPIALLGAMGVIVSATVAVAHDFWIVPDAFQVTSGSEVTVHTVSGTRFPASGSPVSPATVAEARILGATRSTDDSLGDFAVAGKSLVVRHRPAGDGERVIVMALRPATRAMTVEALGRYLTLEGAPTLAERVAETGGNPADSVVMRSAKYAKTIVDVGSGGPRAFAREAGHPVEFIPLSDPAALHEGDTLALRVLAHGRPLRGASVHVGRPTNDAAQPAAPDTVLTAGTDGSVRLAVSQQGLWNVRTANATRAAGLEGTGRSTWEVAWTTFVFRVASPAHSRGK